MADVDSNTLDEIKGALLNQVDEWLGNDIPGENTEDYECWESMVAEIGAIESLDDVVCYLEGTGKDVEEFLKDFVKD